MAGPIPTYLTTQSAAQTAFSVPFGLLALVNSAINTATAAGEFNTTVDCSLFPVEDVAALNVYLTSQGYQVNYAARNSEWTLNVGWEEGTLSEEVVADQGSPGTIPWPVVESPSTDANVALVIVSTSSTQLLGTNLNRRGIIIQSKDSPLYVIVGSAPASTTVYSYYVLKLNALEIDNFFGPISAVVAAGSASVQVTEKI
jgi:hypothetical protein